MIRGTALPGHLGMLLSGAARSLRVSHKSESPEEQAVRRVAADVIAPLIFLFVTWVLDEAWKKQLTKLYFLARDGQIMYRVARELAPQRAPGIELHYLYCSRESLCHILPDGVDGFDLDWLTMGHLGRITLAEVYDRLRCDQKEFSATLNAHGFPAENCFHRPLRKAEIDAIRNIVVRRDVAEYLACKGAAERDLACRYLAQEGLLEANKIGVVDTGWKGTSQYAIERLLRLAAGDSGRAVPELHGFYLGVGQAAWGAVARRMQGFLFDEPKGLKAPVLSNFPCIEMLCSARHGRVRGYVAVKERVRPRLGPGVEKSFSDPIRLQHAIAVSFARRLGHLLTADALPREPTARLCLRLVRDLVAAPGADLVNVYGRWTLGFELRERDRGEMAPPLNLLSLAACVLGRKQYRGFWPQGSFVRGGIGWLCPAYNLFQSLGGVEIIRRLLSAGR